MTDLGSVLITGAIIFTGTVVVCCTAFAFGTFIARALVRATETRDATFDRVVAETPDEIFLEAISKYEGA